MGWHPSGTMLASASFDATVCVWDRKDGGKMWKDTQVSYVGNFGWVKFWYKLVCINWRQNIGEGTEYITKSDSKKKFLLGR